LDGASDDELAELARTVGNDDTGPFEVLLRRNQSFVAANCRAITRSPTDVEDLAQEVFVKAFFGIRRFEGRSSFRGWLHRIKVNHCLNHLRKHRGTMMVDLDDVALEGHPRVTVAPTAHTALQSVHDSERIIHVLDAMSDTLRVPLMLRDADGFSYEEIADRLGISLSAVKMRIKRAREEFRRLYATADHAEAAAVLP
jgi:RNA polymerase sigma-70 factor (ECF subfamily)